MAYDSTGRAERIAAYKKTDKYRAAKAGAKAELQKIKPQLKELKRTLKADQPKSTMRKSQRSTKRG